MHSMRHAHHRVSWGLVFTTLVLLVGVTLLAIGRTPGHHMLFLAGLIVTFLGVLPGIIQVVFGPR